jgi:hypothetical protein
MNELSLHKIDRIIKKCNEIPFFRGNAFGIIYAKRVDNLIYLKSLTHIAEGTIIKEESNMRIVFKYRMKGSVGPSFFIPIIFLLLFLFLPKVTINGEINPSFCNRALFVLIGLVLIDVVYMIFQSGEKVIKDGVERQFAM